MSASPPPFPDLDADRGDDLSRLIGLNDGIYAFSMTLLAVNVSLPSLARDASAAVVTAQILDLLPQFIVFATTFFLVAVYWQVNRRTFRYIVRYDTRLVWLDIFQLLFVAFLPVASGLFDTYADVPAVIVLYTGTLVAIGLLGQVLWMHATGRANLVDESLTPVLRDYYSFRGIVTLSFYFLMLVIGLVAPNSARWFLLVLLLIYPFMKHLFRAWWQRQHPGEYA